MRSGGGAGGTGATARPSTSDTGSSSKDTAVEEK